MKNLSMKSLTTFELNDIVADATEQVYSMPAGSLRKRTNARYYSTPRHMACYVLSDYGLSSRQVNLGITADSVRYATGKVRGQINIYPHVAQEIQLIKNKANEIIQKLQDNTRRCDKCGAALGDNSCNNSSSVRWGMVG